MMSMKQLTIIGLGLMGGSVAYAIKSTQFFEKIVAYDIDINSLRQACADNLIDAYESNLQAAVENADFILIAIPLGQFANVLNTIKTRIKSTAFITDTCSAKTEVISSAASILGEQMINFVPGHPIAGSEKNGLSAAREDLFNQRLVVLTPDEHTSKEAIKVVTQFWSQIGSAIKIMSAKEHDNLFALTSHLPQLLAYTFMQQVVNHQHYPDILTYTGTGFRDFTRLAGSDPALWRDICISNRTAILQEINQFQKELNRLQQAIDKNDVHALLEIFTNAQTARNEYSRRTS